MQVRPAELLLQQFGITDPKEIDLEAIAWTQGVRVRYRPLDGCEARILGNGDQAIITVNSQSSAQRQRFSIAHELGHWKWHRGRVLVCRSDEIGAAGAERSHIERAADNYAADLLMPNFMFRPIASSFTKLNSRTVKAVAETFDVSATAAAIRLVEGDHSPCILVCHGRQGRKWFTRSPDVPSRWFPQETLDADSFAFGVLFGAQPDDVAPRRTGGDAWFNRRGADRYHLMEQTFRIGRNETLTLLLFTDPEMLEDEEGYRWRS
jgi:hypothetical protein